MTAESPVQINTDDVDTQSSDPVKKQLERFKNAYEKISPEKQTAAGMLLTFVYLSLLFSPDSLPQRAQPLVDFVYSLPHAHQYLWITTLLTLACSVDGARKILNRRLPFYREYIKTFFLDESEKGGG